MRPLEIKATLKRHGFSQRDLGDHCGCSQAMISLILNERHAPNQEAERKLAILADACKKADYVLKKLLRGKKP